MGAFLPPLWCKMHWLNTRVKWGRKAGELCDIGRGSRHSRGEHGTTLTKKSTNDSTAQCIWHQHIEFCGQRIGRYFVCRR